MEQTFQKLKEFYKNFLINSESSHITLSIDCVFGEVQQFMMSDFYRIQKFKCELVENLESNDDFLNLTNLKAFLDFGFDRYLLADCNRNLKSSECFFMDIKNSQKNILQFHHLILWVNSNRRRHIGCQISFLLWTWCNAKKIQTFTKKRKIEKFQTQKTRLHNKRFVERMRMNSFMFGKSWVQSVLRVESETFTVVVRMKTKKYSRISCWYDIP